MCGAAHLHDVGGDVAKRLGGRLVVEQDASGEGAADGQPPRQRVDQARLAAPWWRAIHDTVVMTMHKQHVVLTINNGAAAPPACRSGSSCRTLVAPNKYTL